MWRRGEFVAPYCNFMRYFFTATAIIITDQLIKYEIRKNLSLGESIDIVRNLLEITHVVNKGGAWGIFSGFTLPLTVFSAVISVGIILFIAMSKNLSSGMKTALTLIVSGGIGNVTDRLVFGEVTDMFSLSFFSPVFNFADISITFGCIFLLIVVLKDRGKEKER